MGAISTIWSYYHLMGQYVSPGHIIFTAIKWGLLALIFLILLVILCRRLILVKRRNKVLKFFAYTYFGIIPMAGLVLGLKWGAIHGIQTDLQQHYNNIFAGINQQFEKTVDKDFLLILTTGTSKKLPEINVNTNNVIDAASNMLYQRYKTTIDNAADDPHAPVAAKVLLWVNKVSGGKLMAYGLKKSIRVLLEDKLGMDEEVSADLMQKRFDQLMQKGLLATIVETQLDKTFGAMKRGVLYVFLIIMAIPLTEIGIAYYLNYRHSRKATLPLTNAAV